MFFNFSNFLSSSLRILGIANRAIPLVKEMSPTIRTIRTKLSNANIPKANLIQLPKINVNNNSNSQYSQNKNQTQVNNSLTFFH